MNRDEYFMKFALKEAKKAYDKGEVPVGCVIVKDDKIMGDGVRIFGLDGDEELANLDVRTEATDVGFDVLPVFGLTDDAR